ncbi:hypothetical protein D9757_008638 [Collybiopsis confluens]|uniref:Uncharacterized protein n=1 Tax=Collybiopsis confluens TaxID=2823264 RepID=A0A8H5H455_9AGAR|nr:hypothetical protein D9757_008638 [Collybiopsis confluens]
MPKMSVPIPNIHKLSYLQKSIDKKVIVKYIADTLPIELAMIAERAALHEKVRPSMSVSLVKALRRIRAGGTQTRRLNIPGTKDKNSNAPADYSEPEA